MPGNLSPVLPTVMIAILEQQFTYQKIGRTAMARPMKSPEHFYFLTFPEKHIGTFMVMVI